MTNRRIRRKKKLHDFVCILVGSESAGPESPAEMNSSMTSNDPNTPTGTPTNSAKNYSQYSVQALNLLAEVGAQQGCFL